MKPPPPGAAPLVLVPEVSVMIVPAETALPAVPEFDEPAAAAVEKLTRDVLAVHVVADVDGVTLYSVHVVAAPE